MIENILHFLQSKQSEIILKIIQQFDLVFLSVGIAMIIAVPLGLMVYRHKKLKQFMISAASILWTIPSLALLAFFIPFLGIGIKPAIIVLAIYALLPILRNVIVGLESVPAATIEAAKGIGFTPLQRMFKVELPLAFPIMIAGIRTAVSISVGVATLAAFIGAGGLGDFINQGLAMNSTPLLLLGAIPSAFMALVLDLMIGFFERDIQWFGERYFFYRIKQVFVYGLMIVLLVFLVGRFINNTFQEDNANTVVVATKSFTEQFILGQLIVQMLQAHTHLHVIKKFNLGQTAIVQAALVRGDIDMYPEYTGTAYMLVLHKTKILSPQATFEYVKKAYMKDYNLTWLPAFGYNNTEAIIVKDAFAKQYHLKTISDLLPLASNLVIGTPAEFMERADGYQGLHRVYGLKFKAIRQMDPTLMYQAIKDGNVNVIAGFSTDGRIQAYHLKVLQDNKHFYPPYYAAIIIRKQTLKEHPQIRAALKPLYGLINNEMMQEMNYEADIEHKSPKMIAHAFLVAHGLLA